MRLSIAFIFMMMFPVDSLGQSPGLPQQPLSAIYFLHMGESDKPLWPFAICLKEPEASEIAEILEEPLRRYFEFFIIPQRDIEAIGNLLQNSMAKSVESEDITDHSYGSFQVTMVKPKSRNTFLLSPDQSITIFMNILKITSPSQERLLFYVSNLLHKLGID